MPKVEIYVTQWCGYCYRAKKLLSEKGVDFVEHDVTEDPAKRAEMKQRVPGATTVPQILIDGRAIGGSDELLALERQGKLDALLQGAA